MKILLFAALLSLPWWATAQTEPDLLSFKYKIPETKSIDPMSLGSFPEAVAKFEKVTGWKIVFSRRSAAEVLPRLWSDRSFPRQQISEAPMGLPLFTEALEGAFSMTTKKDEATRTLTVDFPWSTTDPRPAAELLKFCREKVVTVADPGKDPEWVHAFNALLSKDENIDRAAPLRQREILSDWFHPSNVQLPPELPFLMRTPLQSVTGERFFGIFFKEPIHFYPGHGSISYYLFQEDGTLVRTGMTNTGWRTALLHASVAHRLHDGKDEASEVHLVLLSQAGDPRIARFVLEDSGLRLIRLFDSFGDTMKNNFDVGESLLTAAKSDGKGQ